MGLVSCNTRLDVETIAGNEGVIRAVERMPRGGGYSTRAVAHSGLSGSIDVSAGRLRLRRRLARPSYCSGATYLVLLGMVDEAMRSGGLKLSADELSALRMHGQADGEGVWGRWNANGPGAAKLVHDLEMGESFESYERAEIGDFMKIFWTNEIGRNERGHLVVFLGEYEEGGRQMVKFWSSNQPRGYGVKSVEKSAIKWAIFTRVTRLENIKNVGRLPLVDSYLSSMLKVRYSRASVRRKCGVAK